MPSVSIDRELERERGLAVEEVIGRALAGDTARAAGNLLFHTDPAGAAARLRAVIAGLEAAWPSADAAGRAAATEFLFKLALDLRSFLPEWHLSRGLSSDRVEELAESALAALGRAEERDPGAAAGVLEALRQITLARFAAEAVEDKAAAEAEAASTLGRSLVEAVRGLAAEIARTNLVEVARSRFRGATTTQLGNNYAAFLPDAIWRGASFVTTNPVLIKVAWDTDPPLWNRRVDGLILGRHDRRAVRELLAGPEEALSGAVSAASSAVTMAVVLESCRLLRDIFLVTGGTEGYVSLQVNPRLHDDSGRMAAEARALHAELTRELGGVPNVVFKLPSTAAGLEAAGTLAAGGIGVTITLTFSVLQAVAFARVLRESRAPVSFIAIMNGRMAFPVRDELAALGVAGGGEAARWAGVEVARKACGRLYGSPAEGGLGVDAGRVKIMIASLRNYNDWLPDLSELWGVPLVTIFPNIRRSFDSHPRPFDGSALAKSTPREALEVMGRSEIFRQAWWVAGDEASLRPAHPLSLDPRDAAALAAWAPMAQTLKQFIELYDQMAAMIRRRFEALADV